MPVVPIDSTIGVDLPANTTRAYSALLALRDLIACNDHAMTALTLGGYRTGLLRTIDAHIKNCKK